MEDSTPLGGGPGSGPASASGPVAERMQALLSRAVEEQVAEQRQAAGLMSDLRAQMAEVADALSSIATVDRVEQLAGDLASFGEELRRSTAGLGERLDAVDRQVASSGEHAAAGSAAADALGVRLGALGADVAAQSTALDRVGAALGALGTLPEALAALQDRIGGLTDRLGALDDLRAGVADLAGRTAALEGLRPELAAVAGRVDQLSSSDEVAAARDAVLGAVGDRLDRVQAAADRPTLTTADLDEALADLRAGVREAAAAGPAVERLDGVQQRFGALEQRLDELVDRLTEVAAAAGAVPGVASDVAAVAGRLDALGPLREQVAELGTAVAAVRDDSTAPSVLAGVRSLREDVEGLGSRVDAIDLPSADSVAAAVSGQVGDRIVEALAPRVADDVLGRVAAVLVEQVAASVTDSVQQGLADRVRAATAESERRMSAHVDEAILALAEALLRRRRGGRGLPVAAAGDPLADSLGEPAAPPAEAPVASQAVDGEPELTASEHTLADEQPVDGSPAPSGVATGDSGPSPDAEPVVPGVAELDAAPEPALDPTEEQAEAELDGREEGSPSEADDEPAPADEPPADGVPVDDAPADGTPGDDVTSDDADTSLLAGSLEEEPEHGPQGALDPADEQADAELEGREVLADRTTDAAPDDRPADEAPAETPAEAAPAETEDPGQDPERTGAFALRSGLRGLGLQVEDPDLSQPKPSLAPPARPRPPGPTTDAGEDAGEDRPAAPPPPAAQEPAPSTGVSGSGDQDDRAAPRRPWWRPGG